MTDGVQGFREQGSREHWIGVAVADRHGRNIGVCSGVLPHDGEPRWLVVRTPWRHQARLVPVAGTQERHGAVLVPFSLSVVLASPDLGIRLDRLSSGSETRLSRYYVSPEPIGDDVELEEMRAAKEPAVPVPSRPESLTGVASVQEDTVALASEQAELETAGAMPTDSEQSDGSSAPKWSMVAGPAAAAVVLGAVAWAAGWRGGRWERPLF